MATCSLTWRICIFTEVLDLKLKMDMTWSNFITAVKIITDKSMLVLV